MELVIKRDMEDVEKLGKDLGLDELMGSAWQEARHDVAQAVADGRRDLLTLRWIPIDHRPLSTGRYIVAHCGHAEIMHFLSPTDKQWMPGTNIGWQGDPGYWGATHCAALPDLPE